MDYLTLLFFLVPLVLLAFIVGFWIKMFVHLLRSDSKDKPLWIAAFIVVGIWGTLIYYYAEYKKHPKQV